jgi:purine-binding chemotaxis protein CheW
MTEDNQNEVSIEEDRKEDRILIFSLGKESYGISIVNVIEIISVQTITAVPGFPEYVKGVINLRGKVIPVIDVRLRFKKEPKEYNDRTCIIVVDVRHVLIGLIVDSVAEVVSISDGAIVDLPHLNNDSDNYFIKKLYKTGNEIKLLIDCEKLINTDDFTEIYT